MAARGRSGPSGSAVQLLLPRRGATRPQAQDSPALDVFVSCPHHSVLRAHSVDDPGPRTDPRRVAIPDSIRGQPPCLSPLILRGHTAEPQRTLVGDEIGAWEHARCSGPIYAGSPAAPVPKPPPFVENAQHHCQLYFLTLVTNTGIGWRRSCTASGPQLHGSLGSTGQRPTPPHYSLDPVHGPGVGLGLWPQFPPPTCSRRACSVGTGFFPSRGFFAVFSLPLLVSSFSLCDL